MFVVLWARVLVVLVVWWVRVVFRVVGLLVF
jgi:hypothetical protein